MYKVHNGMTPQSITNMFQLVGNTDSKETRAVSNQNHAIPQYNIETGRKCFAYRGPTYWNLIDKEIKEKPTHKVKRGLNLGGDG